MDDQPVRQPLLAAAGPELPQRRARRFQRHRRVVFLFWTSIAAVILFWMTRNPGSEPPLQPHPTSDNLPPQREDLPRCCPLDGPLDLPRDPLCHAYLHASGHGTKRYPRATYPIVLDGQHSFSFIQNETRHRSRPGYWFDDQYSFSFRQNSSSSRHAKLPGGPGGHWQGVLVSGQVIVRKAAAADRAPSVDIEALSNDDNVRVVYKQHGTSEEEDQTLHAIVEDYLWVDGERRKDTNADEAGAPCVVIRATIWLPAAAAHLKGLTIHSKHLDILLLEDVDLVVDETALLMSEGGSITASRALCPGTADAMVCDDEFDRCGTPSPFAADNSFGVDYRFEAAQMTVVSMLGSVTGPWTLRDSLSLSGAFAIDVAVADAEVSNKDDGNAVNDVASLTLVSSAGSIRFEEVARDGTPRSLLAPHVLYASTTLGSIRGSGSFSGRAELTTVEGNINVTLQPVALPDGIATDAKNKRAILKSSTESGATDLYLLDEAAGKPLDFLSSTHTTTSGGTRLCYPASWLGGIVLRAVTGSAQVTGKGVHVQPDPGPHYPGMPTRVTAVKDVPAGVGGGGDLSSIDVSAVSGSIRVEFPPVSHKV